MKAGALDLLETGWLGNLLSAQPVKRIGRQFEPGQPEELKEEVWQRQRLRACTRISSMGNGWTPAAARRTRIATRRIPMSWWGCLYRQARKTWTPPSKPPPRRISRGGSC